MAMAMNEKQKQKQEPQENIRYFIRNHVHAIFMISLIENMGKRLRQGNTEICLFQARKE